MGFSEAVSVAEASLERRSDAMVRQIVRETDAMPTDQDGVPAVRMAAARVLKARLRTVWEVRPIGELVEYIRTMPHYQADPVMRCHTDVVEGILRVRFPSVDDDAFDAWQATLRASDPDGVSWPAYLAAAYVDAMVGGIGSGGSESRGVSVGRAGRA